MTVDNKEAWDQYFDLVWNEECKIWEAQIELKAKASEVEDIKELMEERRRLDHLMARIHQKLNAMRKAYREGINPIVWRLTWVDTE
jgi:hypothetical protein